MSRVSEREMEATMLEERAERSSIGFWLYLMTDCILFASLFAVYAILHVNTFGGPGPKELFHPGGVLAETLLLLASSYACGLAVLRARAGEKAKAIFWLVVCFALGVSFLTLEIGEFAELIAEGNSFTRSGFLSAFFTLVATHGMHITIGLIWIAVMVAQLMLKGLTPHTARRLTLFSLFWHFLDVVWIFIFSTVYLMGVA